MYLKSLNLKGFKSFADRTVMRFEPGLAAIVGPNGSGKSNISDAVLWVLGERNAKSLRGQSMEDVIFSGSSALKPVGVAEVELVLDNSDGTLPVDFSEVSIGRRMYRNGESEYLINGSVSYTHLDVYKRQLRGRVGRGEKPGQVYLVTRSKAPAALERLRAMEVTEDGFELSEIDLAQRKDCLLYTSIHGTTFIQST